MGNVDHGLAADLSTVGAIAVLGDKAGAEVLVPDALLMLFLIKSLISGAAIFT